MKIYHNSSLQLVMIPPGEFYSFGRKRNEVEIEKEFSYGYTLTYGISKKFNKNNATCNENLDFLEDKCKLNQVKCITHNIIPYPLPFFAFLRYLTGFLKLTIVSPLGLTISTC